MAESLEQLAGRQCRPMEPGSAAVDSTQAAAMLGVLDGWALEGEGIQKTFAFDDHHWVMAFVNAVAWISHRQDHHPDLQVGYNKVTVRYSTHSVGGLSDNDFICAARVEMLMR